MIKFKLNESATVAGYASLLEKQRELDTDIYAGLKFNSPGTESLIEDAFNIQKKLDGLDAESACEGFWESFWRNGIIIAIIQKCKSSLENTASKCEAYCKDPNSFNNGQIHHDIHAIKILRKSNMMSLLSGLYNLGELIKRDSNAITKAKAANYIKLLKPIGFEVTYDKVKGQYKWNCGSIWGTWGLGILINLGTGGLYGLANSFTFGYLQRMVEKGIHKIPASMKQKGYQSVNDYKQLCAGVAKLCNQALSLDDIEVKKDEKADKATMKLVKSAIDVYQREVREICYAMVKVLTGLNSNTGFLAGY